MTLREQWQALNKSATMNVVAKSFLVGFGGNALWMLAAAGMSAAGAGFDLGSFLPHLTDRAWLYLFFNESFKMGSAAAWGYLGTNGFFTANGMTQLFDTFRTNMTKAKLLLFAFVALTTASLTGCLDSETASLTTTQGETSATLDANPGIQQGQVVTSDNTALNAVVNSVEGNDVILSLPAIKTGMATATFKNTYSMQLKDDAAGLKAFAQNAAATLHDHAPQLVAVANNTAAFTALVQQITSAAGWTPATPSQHSVYVDIENDAKLAATSVAALDSFLSTVQETGAVPAATSD